MSETEIRNQPLSFLIVTHFSPIGVCSTRLAIWLRWLTKLRKRPAPDQVVAAAVSTIQGGGGRGDKGRSRRKRRMAKKQTRSSWWPAWMLKSQRTVQRRSHPEVVVGVFTDEAQSRADKVLCERDRCVVKVVQDEHQSGSYFSLQHTWQVFCCCFFSLVCVPSQSYHPQRSHPRKG